MLLPHDPPANRLSAAAELVQRGLWQWVDEPAGWLYPDWTDRQSTLAQIEHGREIERRKKANWRASTRESTVDNAGSPPGSTATATDTAKGSLAKQPQRNSDGQTAAGHRLPGKQRMTAHHVHRHADDTGYILSCACGLRRVYDSQVARDIAASEHSEYASRRPWPKGKRSARGSTPH